MGMKDTGIGSGDSGGKKFGTGGKSSRKSHLGTAETRSEMEEVSCVESEDDLVSRYSDVTWLLQSPSSSPMPDSVSILDIDLAFKFVMEPCSSSFFLTFSWIQKSLERTLVDRRLLVMFPNVDLLLNDEVIPSWIAP